MTRYADAGDLDTYGALPAASSALFATAQKNAVLDEVSAFADSYMTGRVPELPLTSWGLDLRGACARMAAWKLLQGLRGYDAAGAGNSYKTAYDEAVRWLRDISKGDAKVSGGTTSALPHWGSRVSSSDNREW